MDEREWEKQELEAMRRLALSGADRARWGGLDAGRLLPSRLPRALGGLKYLAQGGDPVADYDVEIAAAFRAPFDPGPEERTEPAPETADAEEWRAGFFRRRRRRRDSPRLFRR